MERNLCKSVGGFQLSRRQDGIDLSGDENNNQYVDTGDSYRCKCYPSLPPPPSTRTNAPAPPDTGPTVPHSLITARLSRSTAGEHVRSRGGQKEVRVQHEEKTKEKTSSQRES